MADHYRVELSAGDEGCAHCGQGQQWTVVSGQGEEAIEIGTSWGDKEHAEDICDLMNMAYDAGKEAETSNVEEDKLVAFFRGDGSAMGREGDHNNWTPAETAIHFLRRSPSGAEKL